MRLRFTRNAKLGLALILTGILPVMYTTHRLHAHNWDPLEVPVVLLPGEFQSPDFVTDLDGTYIVSLAFDTMQDQTREDCLIGWDFPQGSCNNISPTLNFDWAVQGDVADIENAGHFKIYGMSGSGDDEAQLGTFDAKRGGHQKITLRILGDAGELNAAHPRLKVEAHFVYWETLIIENQMAWLLALGAVIASIILIIMKPGDRSRGDRRDVF
jgi:hypothetical protein